MGVQARHCVGRTGGVKSRFRCSVRCERGRLDTTRATAQEQPTHPLNGAFRDPNGSLQSVMAKAIATATMTSTSHEKNELNAEVDHPMRKLWHSLASKRMRFSLEFQKLRQQLRALMGNCNNCSIGARSTLCHPWPVLWESFHDSAA